MTAGSRVMFGVGITDYSWRRLPNAKPEVECLGRSFGCRGYDCYILLDAQESEDVKKFLADLQVSEFTKVLCGYVAAHGVETVDGNVRILLMSSTNEQDADAQHWVTVDDLCNILLTLSCSEDADVYLFLNFCRCQVATSCMEKNGHVQTKRKSLSRKIHIMWACASGQAALEGKPGDFSPFAACLMPLLQEDRDWSFQDLFNKLQPAVSTQSRAACNGFLRPQQLTLTQSAAASYGIFTADAKPKAPRLVGVPAANETFTGRARELELIQTTFNKAAGQCAIVQTRAITGLGGIGKTQLAKAFVYMHQHMYDVVLWIDAERDLATSFRSCAASLVELGPDLTPMQVKAKLDDHLRQYKYWLIIFDNVEKTADIEPYRPAGTGHVLITSRYQLWNKGSTVELGRLARIDAVVLLYRKIFSDDAAAMDTAKAHVRDSLLPWDSQDPADRSAQPPACVPADVVQCWELAALLDDFPLALVQASAAIRFFGFATIRDYCEEYRTAYSSLQKEEEDSLDPGYADGYNRSVHATLKIILSKLAQRDMNHTSASERVLGAVALLDAAIIPHNLLVALVEEMCPELTSNVQKLGVLGNLWRCSLISRLTEDLLDKSTSGNCQQDYTVHRVVQQFVLCQMDQDSRHEAVHGVSKVLNSLLKRSLHESPETVKENRLLLPHVRALTASDKDVQELKDRDPVVLGNLLCLAADFYVHEQRDRKTAKHFLDMADRHSPSATSDAMLQLSVRLLGLQCMFKENLEGNVAEAESHLLQALRLWPDQSPLRAELLHLKGNLKYRQQKFEEAQRYMEEALEMKKQHPAEYNQASLAYSEHGLGNVYAKMHQIFRADTAYAHAIENKVSFYRCEDHLDVARSQCRQVKNMLDQRLMSTADRMKAFQLMMNVVTVFERDLDEEHYEVINAKSLKSRVQSFLVAEAPAAAPAGSSLCFLAPCIHPRAVGTPQNRFYAKLAQVPRRDLVFMKAFAPSEQFQKRLAAQLEDSFLRQAEQFEKDGLLILPSYFQGCLEKWRGWYQHTMERVGSSQPTLHMQTFTATSHTNVELSNDVQAAVADPYLLALLAYVAGGNIQLSDFRAATTHPGEDILFRAWKWHRDGGKEPEWKLMVLLDDVAPGGNETHYLKGSMRRWKGSRQKDANFSMEDALHIASGGSKELPRITRCFGPAGTVILFAGQGLHRATHSKLAQRRVVTFRFKRNVPQLARIYPLDVVKQDQLCSSNTLVRSILVRGSGELLASSEECRFIDEKSSKQKLVQCEQDTSPQETACLLDAYEEMKTLSDLKPRVHSAELAELHSKLLEIFSVDINFDLDLPVRQNNLDVSRDLLRVRFRYLRSGSEQFVDLLKNFHSCADEGLHEPASVSTLQLLAGRLEDWLKSCSSESAELKREAVACQRLTMDVGRALAHLDDVQDLRTVLCFLYLLHDHVRRVFPGCPSWVALDQRILLSTYSFVVLLDDAAASSPADNARGMSHIPNHTRQYLFRAKAHQKTCQPIQVPGFVQKSAAAGG